MSLANVILLYVFVMLFRPSGTLGPVLSTERLSFSGPVILLCFIVPFWHLSAWFCFVMLFSFSPPSQAAKIVTARQHSTRDGGALHSSRVNALGERSRAAKSQFKTRNGESKRDFTRTASAQVREKSVFAIVSGSR